MQTEKKAHPTTSAPRALLQRRRSEGHEPETVPPIVHEVVRSPGQPLDPETRALYELRFGHDFSKVRVHTDAKAAESARAVNAFAYTVGRNLVFSEGQYTPGTASGQQLLAHELTHVLQQGPVQPDAHLTVGKSDDVCEYEAEGIARDFARKPISPGEGSSAQLMRQPLEEISPAPAPPKPAATQEVPFTEELKRKWVAVVLAEAAPDDKAQEEAFAWIYYNRIISAKGERGLRGSSEYRAKKVRYAIWLHKQGDAALKETVIPKWLKDQNPNEFVGTKGANLETVNDVCTDVNGAYQRPQAEGRLSRVQKVVEGILRDPNKNPIGGFQGQGNLQDFNNLSNDDPMWRMARYYFFLYQKKSGLEEWVKVFPATPPRFTQFVFHLDKVKAYLKASGVKDIAKESVPFVDVKSGAVIFVQAKDEISALAMVGKGAAAKQIQRSTKPRAIRFLRSPPAKVQKASSPKSSAEANAANHAASSQGASPEVRIEDVIKWITTLYNLPYGFSADDSISSIIRAQKDMSGEITKLKTQLKSKQTGTPSEERLKAERDLENLERLLAESKEKIATAKKEYWNKTLKELIKTRVTTISDDVLTGIQDYGIVCNIFVEIVMRTSGFIDFPMTGQAYLPKRSDFKKLSEDRENRQKSRPGWGLDWSERMVDWASSNGEILYDDSTSKQIPSEPRSGDIVIFKRTGGGYHVNIVVPEGDGKFNFAGASRPGLASGKALVTPFSSYDEKLRSRSVLQDLPKIMGQEKYLWILRPKYKLPETRSVKDKPEEPSSRKEYSEQ